MSKRLKLYYIDDDYVEYLREFDDRVPYNKKGTRPFVGVVYEYNGFNYFAPLASPKTKHLKISTKALDVFKIDDGKLGIVNLNNMIPTPSECLTEVISSINDIQYKILLNNQIAFLNSYKDELYAKTKKFQNQYRKGYLDDKVKSRSCNFLLLEEKCLEYNKAEVGN